jgi:very-short-patch-repair endonuclease
MYIIQLIIVIMRKDSHYGIKYLVHIKQVIIELDGEQHFKQVSN